MVLLPPALELMTAWTEAGEDPRFCWEAMRRVVGDSLTGADPGRAVAELLFGLSALGGILLDQLADTRDQAQVDVLQELRQKYGA